jgi:hypothetical protein
MDSMAVEAGEQTLALDVGWLNCTSDNPSHWTHTPEANTNDPSRYTTTTGDVVITTPTYTGTDWTWGYSWQTWKRVRLTLTEVMYLRRAGRRDKKLRRILRKFTEVIELEIDL